MYPLVSAQKKSGLNFNASEMEVPMADSIHDLLRFINWRIPDPGPPWLIDIVDKETKTKLAVSALQLEKDILNAQNAAIDRQIQALKGGKG